MAANHNSPEPEGGYDPAGSTQMFRAFVEEAEPARTPSVPGARRRQKDPASKSGAVLGLAFGLLLVFGAALWLVLR
ncbi:hypothetical protein ABZZ17_15805 [Streptomyces sp. NPDC006512]|uniref:hypothetical protein n=1 Tax=Streptomyces sp. NPDC006512 TaxID=3154307 RepID=UPI0033A642DC